MGKNQSKNATLTSEALRHYYREAQIKGLVPELYSRGVSEGAIRTAISRGRISRNMVDAFHSLGLGSVDELVGSTPLTPSIKQSYAFPTSLKPQFGTLTKEELLARLTVFIYTIDILPSNSSKDEMYATLEKIAQSVTVSIN